MPGPPPDPRVPYVGLIWNGQDVSSWVRAVDIEDDDRLTDKAQLLLEGPTAAATFGDQQSVRVSLGWPAEDQHAVLFDGLITHVENVTGPTNAHRTRIDALDLSSKMNVTAEPHTWDHGTLTSQIKELVEAHGIDVATVESDPDPTFTPEHPVTSPNQTDLVFLQELARRYGCRAFVEWNAGASHFYFVREETLMAHDPLGLLNWCAAGGALKAFTYRRGAGGAPPSITATTVDPTTGETRTATPQPPATPDPVTVDPATAPPAGSGERAGLEAAVLTAGTSTETHADHVPAGSAAGGPSDPVRAAQEVRRDPTTALGFTGEGTARGTIQLRAKARVTIQGVAEWAAGDWYLRRVVHAYRDTSTADARGATYETRFAVTR